MTTKISKCCSAEKLMPANVWHSFSFLEKILNQIITFWTNCCITTAIKHLITSILENLNEKLQDYHHLSIWILKRWLEFGSEHQICALGTSHKLGPCFPSIILIGSTLRLSTSLVWNDQEFGVKLRWRKPNRSCLFVECNACLLKTVVPIRSVCHSEFTHSWKNNNNNCCCLAI